MKKYIVQCVRVEHIVCNVYVEAESEAEANDKAREEMYEMDWTDGEIVHADEFTNDITEVQV